jgi:hypothetical protein
MFRSIYTKTLRDYRVPILAWGIGLALVCTTLRRGGLSRMGEDGATSHPGSLALMHGGRSSL